MITTSGTRSIQIDAPVEEVFAFVADPVKRLGAFTGRSTVVSDVETSPEGVVERYTATSHLGPLPIHGVGTQEQIADQRVVDGTDTWTLEPSGTGTKLTISGGMSSRIPLLDKVMVYIATSGKGVQPNMEQWLAEIKRQIEAGR